MINHRQCHLSTRSQLISPTVEWTAAVKWNENSSFSALFDNEKNFRRNVKCRFSQHTKKKKKNIFSSEKATRCHRHHNNKLKRQSRNFIFERIYGETFFHIFQAFIHCHAEDNIPFEMYKNPHSSPTWFMHYETQFFGI